MRLWRIIRVSTTADRFVVYNTKWIFILDQIFPVADSYRQPMSQPFSSIQLGYTDVQSV